MWKIISSRINQLIHNDRPLKLIVIDSLAALFRFEFSKDDAVEKTKVLWDYANQLKEISSRHSVAIVVVNQVTGLFANTSSPGGPIYTNSYLQSLRYTSTTSSGHTVPALGLAWANFVNTRIILSRTTCFIPKKRKIEASGSREPHQGPGEHKEVVRKMKVVLSPCIPESECFFVVNNSGIQSLDL